MNSKTSSNDIDVLKFINICALYIMPKKGTKKVTKKVTKKGTKNGTKRRGFRKLNKMKGGGFLTKTAMLSAIPKRPLGAAVRVPESRSLLSDLFGALILYILIVGVFKHPDTTSNYTGLRYDRDLSKITYTEPEMPLLASSSSIVSLKPDFDSMVNEMHEFEIPDKFNIEEQILKLGLNKEVVTKTSRLIPRELKMVDFDYLVSTRQIDFLNGQRTFKGVLAKLLERAKNNEALKNEFHEKIGKVNEFLIRWANDETFRMVKTDNSQPVNPDN
jgi:hypothetical protein